MSAASNMSWDQYQAWVASKMAPDASLGFVLGLCGEAGEVADLIKKRDFHKKPCTTAQLAKELGDVLFYVAAVAQDNFIPMTEVVQANLDKLNNRYPKGFDPDRSHAAGEKPIEE